MKRRSVQCALWHQPDEPLAAIANVTHEIERTYLTDLEARRQEIWSSWSGRMPRKLTAVEVGASGMPEAFGVDLLAGRMPAL
jgi:hypothetical protein